MIQMKINPDKIREVIGSGGKVIQKICADTGCKIDIEDDGSIFIASEDIEACRAARKTIENIVFEPEVGELYYGKVSNIRSDFGAWVELAPGKDGLVKIKDLEFKRTEKVEDVLKIGDMTWVKVMNVDDRGRIDLSRKDAMREKGLMNFGTTVWAGCAYTRPLFHGGTAHYVRKTDAAERRAHRLRAHAARALGGHRRVGRRWVTV